MKQKRKYIYVSFYANKKRLGGGYIPEASNPDERQKVAKSKGILNHNAIVFHDRKKYIKFRRRPSFLHLRFTTLEQNFNIKIYDTK